MKTQASKFFTLSFAYLLGTIIWVLIFVEEPISFMEGNARRTSIFLKSLTSGGYNFSFIVVAIVMSRVYHGWRSVGWGQVLTATLLTLVGVAIFMAAFATVETSFAMVMPFYADGCFAEMDRWLLLGQDAWVVAHRYFPELGAPLVDLIYGRIWIPLVFLFPFYLVLFDKNQERVARYILLYFVAFFIVGNVLALMFLSVGPVYYDTYYGEDTFARLQGALEGSGVSTSHIGRVQTILGDIFFANDGTQASDIAAFPSVHVSSIMVVALYAFERNRVLGVIMSAYVGAILFLSVYTGYHWLVDGLASILIMIVANFWLTKSRLTKLLST
ncbi:MAG TPA: hypothetical protein EYG79_00070 [Rhodobacteraceae bacterium]|nr:hypothetical protein [Paracoccaceae bacterium]